MNKSTQCQHVHLVNCNQLEMSYVIFLWKYHVLDYLVMCTRRQNVSANACANCTKVAQELHKVHAGCTVSHSSQQLAPPPPPLSPQVAATVPSVTETTIIVMLSRYHFCIL